MVSNFKLTFFGHPILFIEKTNSTNSCLKECSNTQPCLVYTDFQTDGRGQYGKNWTSKAGDNLLFSFQFYPQNLALNQLNQISQQIAISIVKVLNNLINDKKVKIKWPNDLLVNNKKVGGILIETNLQGESIQKIIVGIGININQKLFNSELPNASSLSIEIPTKKWNKETILQLLIKEFEELILLVNSPLKLNNDLSKQIFNHNLDKFNQEITLKYEGIFQKFINLGVNEKGHWMLREVDSGDLIEIKSSSLVEYIY